MKSQSTRLQRCHILPEADGVDVCVSVMKVKRAAHIIKGKHIRRDQRNVDAGSRVSQSDLDDRTADPAGITWTYNVK